MTNKKKTKLKRLKEILIGILGVCLIMSCVGSKKSEGLYTSNDFYAVIRPEGSQLTNITPDDYVMTFDNIVAVNPKSGEFVVRNTERIDTVSYPKKGRNIIMFYSKDSLLFDAKLISSLESTLPSGLTFCHYDSDKNGLSRYMLEIPFVNHDGKTEDKSDQKQQQGIQRMYQILEKAGKTSNNKDVAF
jgi:hypothetical protein